MMKLRSSSTLQDLGGTFWEGVGSSVVCGGAFEREGVPGGTIFSRKRRGVANLMNLPRLLLHTLLIRRPCYHFLKRKWLIEPIAVDSF